MSKFFKTRPDVYQRVISILRCELDLSQRDAEYYLNVTVVHPRSHPPVERSMEEISVNIGDKLSILKTALTTEEILSHPQLIIYSPKTIQYRANFLRAIGMVKLKPIYFIHFFRILKSTPTTLKRLGVLPSNLDLVSKLFENLDFPSERRELVISKHLKDSENIPIAEIKQTITLEYFSWKMSVATGKPHYDPQFVFRCGYVTIFSTEIYKDYVKRLPQLTPNVINASVTKILRSAVNTTKEKLDILKKYQLEELALKYCLTCYSADTLRKRLQYLHQLYGECIINDSPASAKLFIHYHQAKKYIEDHGQVPLRELYYNVLYDIRKSKSNEIESIDSELMSYLMDTIPESEEVITAKLKEHPFWQYVTINEAPDIYDYLRSESVTIEQIFNGLYILFYCYNRVKDAFNLIKGSDEFDQWQSHPLLVHLLIYHLEQGSSKIGMGTFT